MILIFDADILSTLVKTNTQKLLLKLYPQAKFIVPKPVFVELKRGFFQEKKLSAMLDERMFEIKEIEFKKLKKVDKRLHSGEIEAIALALKLKAIFLSNDGVALEVAKSQGIKTQSLKQLLIGLAKKKVIRKAQMMKLLRDIEEKDYTVILKQEDILRIYD